MPLNRAILLCGFLGCALLSCPEDQGSDGDRFSSPLENLIQNPSFEERDGSEPRAWKPVTWRGKGSFRYVQKARTGTWCVMIASDDGADAGWQTGLAVKPFSRYKLSAWIKTENLNPGSGKGALLNLHNMQPEQTTALSGTRDWTKVELDFDSKGNDFLEINCLFGGWGMSTGKAWFDDISLERISTRELKPAVTLHGHETGPPISKYIYGQFIEHLGRCIYGGIWAEMLEDRKFFFPVGEGESPWDVQGRVSMMGEKVFVGEHSPMIEPEGPQDPAILTQGGLALTLGKDYVGRIVLAGEDEDGPVEISLVWGGEERTRHTLSIPRVLKEYTSYPLRFKAGLTTDEGRLEISPRGSGALSIGAVSLMPADHVEGFRPDTLALLKELNAPIYRWPGGNFVSGYDWKDGIGDPDRRPIRKNPAWKGIEPNDVGLHEFLTFCRLVDAEPCIVVNTGLGDATSAAQEVEYVNGSQDTPMGRWRSAMGRPEPFGVKWWGIGNEMYGSWQLGHMPLEEYVEKHNRIARAMQSKSPGLLRIGVGSVGRWSERMLLGCANDMEMISEHFYCGEQPGLWAHVAQIPAQIKRIAGAHREYRKKLPSLAGREIPIALDEWNYWYGPHLYGELGTRYFLKDALGIAEGLHEFFRNSDIITMANYAQTVNVIGCIKTSKRDAEFATTGLVLKLYRNRFGTLPVEITGSSDPLDVSAAWTEDKRALTLSVVNPMKSNYPLSIECEGVSLSGAGRLWSITGPGEKAFNEPGAPPQVKITEQTVSGFSGTITAPPLSILLYELHME